MASRSLCFRRLFWLFLLTTPSWSSVQDAKARPEEGEARAALSKAISRMGATAPKDSMSAGHVDLIEGTRHREGRIWITTRGLDQCAESTQFENDRRLKIVSHGEVRETSRGGSHMLSLESFESSQCMEFPLPWLQSVERDPDMAFNYIGEEVLDNTPVLHIRFWNTFASKRALEALAQFTTKDLWIDAVTGLPKQVSFERKEGRGAVPGFKITISFSGWRVQNGVAYPGQIDKTLNGVPWMSITMQSVAFGVGLTDDDFAVTRSAE